VGEDNNESINKKGNEGKANMAIIIVKRRARKRSEEER